MYDSFIDIWEGSPMWGQHIEDWKTSEEQNDDSSNRWIVELADNGWMDHICPRCHYKRNLDNHVINTYRYCPYCGKRLYGGGNDDGSRRYD
jgi:hypothetical protein